MYCIHCGKELPENSKFCNHCGGSQQNETVNIPQTYNDAEGNKTFRSTKQMREAMKADKQNKGFSKGCTTAAYILAIIVGLIIAIGVFGDSDSEPKDKTSKASTTVETTEAPIEITASKLVQAYIDNEVKADTIYDDKTVIISGRVNRIEQTDYLFMENELIVYVGTGEDIENCLRCYVSAEQKDVVAELEQGDKITLTGRCVGLGSAYFNLKCVNIYDGVISE